MSRTVVITGAGGGLGSIFAKEFAKTGYRVAILDFNIQAGQKVACEIEQAGGDESVRVKLGLRTITLCPECAELQNTPSRALSTARTWAPRHFARHVLRIVTGLPCARRSARLCVGRDRV